MKRIIRDSEGNIPPIFIYVVIILLLPLFLYEGYVLMQTAQNIEVEDVYVGEYTTEIEEGTDNVTKIEMDVNIDIRNSASRDIKIERLKYELTIEPENFELEDVKFDSGEVGEKTIHGNGVTTITIPVENENEGDIENIQDYILEENGEVDAVAEIHVPLLQMTLDYPVTTVSRELRKSLEYEPIISEYEIDEQNATLEKAGVQDEADHVLKIPYMLSTNENEFLSGEVGVDTTMESRGGNITSADEIQFSIGDERDGNFSFGLDENDTEELLTDNQTIEFYSDIDFEENISFQLDHDRSIESPAMLEDFNVEEDNATLEEAEESESSEYVLKTPYEIKTNDNDFISGFVDINTTMTDHVNITSSDEIEFEIGEDKDGHLRFGLNENDIEELLTEDQTIDFTSDISYEEENISFEREHRSVYSEAMLVNYTIKGDQAELNETGKYLEIPYYIETNETAFFEEGGNISINTTMETKDGNITSSTSFEIEIGETEEGTLKFGLDDDEINELKNESKTLQFVSDVKRDNISFEYDHDEEAEWVPPSLFSMKWVQSMLEKLEKGM